MNAPMNRPLDGITVLSLEQAVAAPFATRQLADLGGRVIKVERPGVGDFARAYDTRVRGEASYFIWANRSKESLTLDVKHPKAQRILSQLLAKADVFVQNLAPGAASRLGLSAKALRSRYRRLVVCDVSGYGNTGPYCRKKAYDLLIQAEAGLLSVTGTPDQVVRAGISVADIAGGMYAYSAILAALIQRGRTGEGSHIEVSLLEALAEWMGSPLYYAFEGQPQAARTAASHPSIYPYGPFETADGKTVIFGLQNEREWWVFCSEVLRRADLAADSRFESNAARSTNREELRKLIDGSFRSLTAQQLVARLDEFSIGNASVSSIVDVWAHPQLKARDRWTQVDSPVGSIPALKPPAIFDTFDYRMDSVPMLGQHNSDILLELGYSTGEIEQFRAENVI